MTAITLREQLQKQIDKLPNEIVEQIADFTLFIMTRRKITPDYEDWSSRQWQEFSLGQFFGKDDEVEYTLEDGNNV